MKTVHIYSPIGLEPWGPDNPDTKGIGGSETAHIEMCRRLSKRGFSVESYTPLESPILTPGLNWRGITDALPAKHPEWPEKWIVFRDPSFFDLEDLNADTWFIAQDVDYAWTPERLKRVNKYFCLCPTHASYTAAQYPELRPRIYLSSNGIKSDKIKDFLYHNKTAYRDLNKFVYTSSPDRGLAFALENWFRVRERMPGAELHVFYGFDNMEKIYGDAAAHPLKGLQSDLSRLLKQPGVIWRGRLPQEKLWYEYLTAGTWFYPTDWPETSCISCMEAQALGAIPVTSDYWALKQNVNYGFKTASPPQHDDISKCLILDYAEASQQVSSTYRREMQEWALDTFDWAVIAKQWEKFLNE